MSRTTRWCVGGAALMMVIGGIWLGLMPKAIHLADCGSPFLPADTALARRYTLLWWLFIAGGVLGLVAALGGVSTRTTTDMSARSG